MSTASCAAKPAGTCSAADKILDGREPQGRQGAGPCRTPSVPTAGRQGDQISLRYVSLWHLRISLQCTKFRRYPEPCRHAPARRAPGFGAHDPDVWSDRAVQEVSSILVMRSCIDNLLASQCPLFVPGGRSFVPACACSGAPRTRAVKAGRRDNGATCARVCRPRLDGPEHGATIKQVGTKAHWS